MDLADQLISENLIGLEGLGLDVLKGMINILKNYMLSFLMVKNWKALMHLFMFGIEQMVISG